MRSLAGVLVDVVVAALVVLLLALVGIALGGQYGVGEEALGVAIFVVVLFALRRLRSRRDSSP